MPIPTHDNLYLLYEATKRATKSVGHNGRKGGEDGLLNGEPGGSRKLGKRLIQNGRLETE